MRLSIALLAWSFLWANTAQGESKEVQTETPAPRSLSAVLTARSDGPAIWDDLTRALGKGLRGREIGYAVLGRVENALTATVVTYADEDSRSAYLEHRDGIWKLKEWSEPVPLPDEAERKDCPPRYVATYSGECVTPPVLTQEGNLVHPQPGTRFATPVHVKVNYVIRKDGSVGQVKVEGCNRPKRGYEEAAVAATLELRYIPALLDGQPVELQAYRNYTFAR